MTVDFNDYFWGDKNNGYEVLYQNMKYGLSASKELSEYFRERSNLDEYNSKLLQKLANKAGSSGANGTFSPLWVILKTSAERLSELHSQMMQKTTELVKSIIKYADELHKKHKTVKEEESSTQEVVHQMKESTVAVQKAKDTYTNRLQELEKLRKDNASAKDIEKAEAKLKKHQEEYKTLVEKHNPIKQEFERKMTITCKRFQEIEEAHLKQMKDFITTYIDIVQNNHETVGQVHSDFKRQFLELTVDKLLEHFVSHKYTGIEKPELIEIVDFTNNSSLLLDASTSTANNTSMPHNALMASPLNNTASSFESPIHSTLSPNQSQTQPQPQVKKESNLRSWFTSSSSTSTSSAMPSGGNSSITSSSSSATQVAQTSAIGGMTVARPTELSPTLSSGTTEVSGFLRSRREKAKSKKGKKKKDGETNSTKEEKTSDIEEKEDVTSSPAIKSETSISAIQAEIASTAANTTPTLTTSQTSATAPTATPEVDEEGYSIRPSKNSWDKDESAQKSFYSSSDSDSDDDRGRKIHVEIKPLNNGTAPISASVDELRATVETLSLSPIGVLSGRRNSNSESDMKRSQSVSQQIGDKPSNHNDLLGFNIFQQHQQSPLASNSSTPTATHPYAPLQSPTPSITNNSNNRYADLGDIFSEVGDISVSAPASANLSKISRQIPTPTSGNSIAIPRPPSRRSEAAVRGRVSPAMARADSVGSLEFRTAAGIGSSRGPSPLTIGMSDTVPLAVAFHEIIHAFFKGSDESKCQVKMSGDMMLSFPAGIVNVLANNPNPAKLCFRIKNVQNLDNILPNKQLINVDKLQSTNMSTTLEFNMPALTLLLRRQSEQNPNASYFNVDILKYSIRAKQGAQSCPFQLVSYWKCETSHTDIKIDYKYNSHAMASPSPLLNVTITVPIDGGVQKVQSKPHSAWLGESNKLVWNFTDISQHSDNSGIDTLRARLEITNGPSTPSMLTTQFNCEGTTLSGIDFELAGSGYRISLVKRRFVAGKYICEGDGIRSTKTPTPPVGSTVGSPNPYIRTG